MLSKVSYRYARAFYEEVSQGGVLTEVMGDMSLISETLEKNYNLSVILNDPSMASDHKFEVLKDIFSKYINSKTLSFINFLAAKKRIALIREVPRQLERIHRREQGVYQLEVVLSPGLGQDFGKKIVDKLTEITGHKFDPDISEDKSLEGGFVYTYQGTVYDYSIKGGMRNIDKILNASTP